MDPSNVTLQVMAGNSLESQEKKVTRPQEQALKCPRCDSTNTKFCYYNNYSLSQPRYFCKGCKRYWTQGGTLRNVPVGGGCRKNTKRSSSSSSSSAKRNQEQEQLVQFHHLPSSTNSNHIIPTLPLLTYDPNDLTLAFASLHNQNHQNQLPLGYNNSLYGNLHFHSNSNPNPNTNTSSTLPTPTPTTTTNTTTFLDALKSGFLDTQGGISQNLYNGYGNEELGEVLTGAEEMFLPYEDMSGSTTTTTATTVTTTRQELCRGRDGDQINNRGFWNFPWQQQVGGGEESLGGDGGGGDAGREYWNGLGQSWHGLVNSPLM